MKKAYEAPLVDITKFFNEDIIMTSGEVPPEQSYNFGEKTVNASELVNMLD